MSNKENIEKLFSETFQNYEAPVDPSAWQAIQSGMQAGAGSGAGAGNGGFWSSIVAKVPGGIAGLGAAVVGTGIIIGSVLYFTKPVEEKVTDVKPGVLEQTIEIEEPVVETEQVLTQNKKEEQAEKKNYNTPAQTEILNSSNQKEEKIHSEKSPSNQALSPNKKESNNPVVNTPENNTSKNSNSIPAIVNTQPSQNSQEEVPAPVMKVLARIQANPVGGTAPLTVTFNNEAEGRTLKWDFGNGEESKVNGLVRHTFNKVGKQTVILIATNANGKTESDTVYIEVLPSSEISPVQNVFTPNEDGLNDVFIIQGKDLAQLKVNIFNAAGKLVYKWDGLNGQWDGKLGNGEEAPAGPYYYVIQAVGTDSKKFKQNGTVNLIR